MHSTKAFKDAHANLTNVISVLDTLKSDANDQLQQLCTDELEELGLSDCIVTRYHSCQNSPVLYCAYKYVEDPCRDDCVFCGHPEERK